MNHKNSLGTIAIFFTSYQAEDYWQTTWRKRFI